MLENPFRRAVAAVAAVALSFQKSIELGRCRGSREAWDGHASDSRGVLPLSGGNAWKMPAVVSTGAAEVINGDNIVQRCTEGTCPQELSA